MKSYIVRIPASTANLGSGFDTLGMALTLYNEITFTPDQRPLFETELSVEGEGARILSGGEKNMILNAMQTVAEKAGESISGGKLHCVNRIPLARGLGSSSSAIAGGVYLANELLHRPFVRREMVDIATELEGHPDNVAPALLGGFSASVLNKGKVRSVSFPVPVDWKVVVAIPDFEVLTEKARSVLPDTYERADCIHTLGALSFLLSAFFEGISENLREGFSDRIHVPYRLSLIPGGENVIENAYRAGAYGGTVSGAGPTMIAFCNKMHAKAVGESMVSGFKSKNISSRYLILSVDQEGTVIKT